MGLITNLLKLFNSTSCLSFANCLLHKEKWKERNNPTIQLVILKVCNCCSQVMCEWSPETQYTHTWITKNKASKQEIKTLIVFFFFSKLSSFSKPLLLYVIEMRSVKWDTQKAFSQPKRYSLTFITFSKSIQFICFWAHPNAFGYRYWFGC